jgi:hypothetical protein
MPFNQPISRPMIRFLGEGFHLLEHWYVVKIHFLPPNDPSEVQIIRFSEISVNIFGHVTTFEINSDPRAKFE